MDCTVWEESLSAYLDHELDAQENADVMAHLDTCSLCSKSLNELSEVRKMVRALSRVAAPETLRGAIERKIKTEKPLPVPIFARFSRGLAAVAASLIAILGLITLLGYLAPESASFKDKSAYLSGHASLLMRQPLADHSSWSYISGESNFDLLVAED